MTTTYQPDYIQEAFRNRIFLCKKVYILLQILAKSCVFYLTRMECENNAKDPLESLIRKLMCYGGYCISLLQSRNKLREGGKNGEEYDL